MDFSMFKPKLLPRIRMLDRSSKSTRPSLHCRGEYVSILPAIASHFGPSPSTSSSNIPAMFPYHEHDWPVDATACGVMVLPFNINRLMAI
jgi:hypothetical protein